MGKISKLLTASILMSSILFANNSDNNVLEFEKKRLSKNPNINLVDIKINMKKELPKEGWYGYILDVEAKHLNKSIKVKDILFTDGKYITLDLFDLKSGKSLKELVTPNLTSNYHDKSKLIAGSHNAKDKIVIFSDPLCPFCMDYVPEVIKYVNENSDSIALYYYHYPLLRLHPAADALSKIIEVAKEKGIKNVELKSYQTDWDKHFDSKSTDVKVILEGFNKEFKTNIKVEEISTKELKDLISKDISMGQDVMVQGTPTIFINGVKDNSRKKYKTLGKN